MTSPGALGSVALVVVLSAQLVVVLDFSIVNVALPSISSAFHASSTSVQWVVTAYALTFGALLVLGGRAADLFGRRRLFVWGLVGFAVASAAGGVATSLTFLIVARAVQGVAAATAALADGYRLAMGVCAALAVAASVLSLVVIREGVARAHRERLRRRRLDHPWPLPELLGHHN